MKPIISVENLGKRFRIMKGARSSRLNPEPPSLFRRGPKMNWEDFWALNDVSFDVIPGERLGIIGRNGAGKSTLLKLLSRISVPTTGRITLRGRVASLLEVGTGFHPELTGRENIFLNGGVLGMSRKEIVRKFDEIVDFSGVEEFLDVPVKRYSSGMYVRLGFAVAAHLEPDILIVDEVLAVGDMDFQKKCLGKMEEVSTEQGRSVLFVSHNMNMMTTLCQRGLLMDSGKCVFNGNMSEAVLRYRGGFGDQSRADFTDADGLGDATAKPLSIRLSTKNGASAISFDREESIHLHMEYEVMQFVDGPIVPRIDLITSSGETVFISSMPGLTRSEQGRFVAECIIPGKLLNVGQFSVDFLLQSFGGTGRIVHFVVVAPLAFVVTERIFESNDRYGFGGALSGCVRPDCRWSQTRI
ncbi:ABC transporter related protein [Solidesulfovibrio fructosivorans JJ]]|uniref:ABC transporter related protein n=1 Tax=Solidesulfovibrio fructosivorans JJ] TaxID=596151 RepID=E1JXN1_SOLFR|nr:ABC transporter ATP-binding protein [Solidesulfovibrio fructosivorans]EFL50804.1 ABC transporter related protein [Solidesulfovibrio fructosivorans JJ]]